MFEELRTRQKDSLVFELDGSTPRSLSFRFNRLVIPTGRRSKLDVVTEY